MAGQVLAMHRKLSEQFIQFLLPPKTYQEEEEVEPCTGEEEASCWAGEEASWPVVGKLDAAVPREGAGLQAAGRVSWEGWQGEEGAGHPSAGTD